MHKYLILLFVTFGMAQDTTELKIIKAPPISLDKINQVPDREGPAIEAKTDQVVSQINAALQDSIQGNANFQALIGNEKLTAVNSYEARVLKSITCYHKILAVQLSRGLLTQEQYEMACRSLTQTFRSASAHLSNKDQS
jgi:predicted RNA-binding protein associated with RNAse of E/G family